MKKIITLFLLTLCFTISAESRIKVVVIDTGISQEQAQSEYACKDSHRSFVDYNIYDDVGHGTNIISIISKAINTKTHCIMSLKVFSKTSSNSKEIDAVKSALSYAVWDEKIEFLNLSFGGPARFLIEEQKIKILLKNNVKVTVAAGNEGKDLTQKCEYFPACLKKDLNSPNFFVVNSLLQSANYGDIITDTFSGYQVGTPSMSGTSQASAQKMASLISGKSEESFNTVSVSN